MNLRRMNPRVVLPISVLAVAIAGAALLMATGSPVEGRPDERILRAVRVFPVETRAVELTIRSQGTVSPRTESELVAEVSGRVVWTSPALVSGGYFDADEALLRIDPVDYQAAVERAIAVLERAEGELEHAQRDLERQRSLSSSKATSRSSLNNAQRQSKVTGANLREARVSLDQARRDLARCEVAAPFVGRVREESVDVGQFLNRGAGFATVYATDAVEIRLPIADAQLGYLSLPIWRRAELTEDELPGVTLRARFAGLEHEWRGKVVRTEGQIDAKSRFVHVVARVVNDAASGQPPLPVGLFVQARIEGRIAQDVAVIPRSALYDGGKVLVVGSEDRLRFRDVEVLRFEQDEAYIASGLADGERVCISSIAAPVDGMRVRPVVEKDQRPAGTEAPRT